MIRKRGISQLVATVLLVGFIIALIALVIIWGRHYIEERAAKEGAVSKEKFSCSADVKITVNDVSYAGNKMDVTVENLKETVIGSFIMRVTGSVGTDPVDVYESLGKLSVKTFSFEFDESTVGVVNKVDVIPQLEVADGVYVPCSDQHVVYNV